MSALTQSRNATEHGADSVQAVERVRALPSAEARATVCRRSIPFFERGASAVEFALVVAFIFLPLILAITSFGRWIYVLNAASEATRYGARVAAVCDKNSPAIKSRMREFLPDASDSNISVTYSPEGCAVSNCQSVTVSLQGLTVNGLLWFAPPGTASLLPSYPVPAFAHTLTRESMRSEIDGSTNPMCN